jgi:LacI family transcriptional regulator
MSGTTLSNIARALGYSKNTISLALRDDPQIPAVTRDKIKATAEKLGYRPNAVVAHLMAQLRSARTSRLQAKLALVNANLDRGAFKDHPTIPIYVEGCERRAHSLGYDFDRFWLHDPELTAERWIRILTARGIKGLILVGLMDTNHLPANLEAVWRRFPCVVTGVRTRDPALSFCCVDHYDLALTAFEQALQLGYQRPGLVLDDVIDALVERRFSAGYMAAQRRTTRSQRIPVFGDVAGPDRSDMFRSWLDRHEPDVVFTLYNSVLGWLKSAGRRIPEDVGVIQLEWRASRPDIAGMNQHNRVTGEAAVDMVVSQIHNNEAGIQEFPRSTMIGATWVGGGTVRSRDTPAQVPRARARKKA